MIRILSRCRARLPGWNGGLSAQMKHVDIKDAKGTVVGMAMISPAKGGGVSIDLDVRGLPPASTRVHFHAVPKCEAPFTSAGGHFNPTNKKHGLQNPEGAHAGDMSNFTVDAKGNAQDHHRQQERHDGPRRQFDVCEGGTALVIHATADDMKTDPAGNAGDPIACGRSRSELTTMTRILMRWRRCAWPARCLPPSRAANRSRRLRRPRNPPGGARRADGHGRWPRCRSSARSLSRERRLSRGRCRWIRIRSASRSRARRPSCCSWVRQWLKNVFVYVKDGLGARRYAVPATPVMLDQKGCRYEPHVFGVQAGQTVQVANSDPLCTTSTPCQEQPRIQLRTAGQAPPVPRVFDQPEIGCRFDATSTAG